MYKIEKRPSGYILTFSGMIDAEEMLRWKEESSQILKDEKENGFGVIINLTDIMPLNEKSQKILIEGQALYKNKGMHRSAVILVNTIVQMQFKRLAKASGINDTERYIDASTTTDPVETAINWVKHGIDTSI